MNVYIKFTYELGDSEPTYIGPFPDTEFLARHRNLYGPVDSDCTTIVTPDELPNDAHLMSPGEAVDYALRMI